VPAALSFVDTDITFPFGPDEPILQNKDSPKQKGQADSPGDHVF